MRWNGAAPVRVKVCGLTEPANARAVAELGVDEIGLNFWPGSPRCVSVERARAIMAALPATMRVVGVFVDAPGEEIDSTAAAVGLAAVQLHGDESPEVAAARRLPVIKAIRTAPGLRPDDLVTRWRGRVLLLDAWRAGQPGGTGQVADWTLARALADRGCTIYLAGGLTPDNLADAVEAVHPFAVDLNSGVERAPGLKDLDRLAAALRTLGRAAGPAGERA